MATAAFGKFIDANRGLGDVTRSAMRMANHIAHEERELKTMAIDAIEDRVADVKPRIRKEPFKFVGIAFAIGVPVGVALAAAFSDGAKRFGTPAHHGS